jgi:hypothetical protein
MITIQISDQLIKTMLARDTQIGTLTWQQLWFDIYKEYNCRYSIDSIKNEILIFETNEDLVAFTLRYL